MEFQTEKRLLFAHSRAAVWAAMADVDSYRHWWPWLRAFEADGLVTGDVWRCTVSPPLGYSVSFDITFDDVVAEERIAATVAGDVAGAAALTLVGSGAAGACEVVVQSNLQPRSAFLRLLTATLRPVARRGHDWVLSTGAAQFEARALASADAPDTTR